VPRRIAASLSMAVLFVAVLATPAFATEENVPKADIKHPWHYWISFALAAGFVLFVIAQAVGYYLKVVRGPRQQA
jgi:uncharacterized membrane protein